MRESSASSSLMTVSRFIAKKSSTQEEETLSPEAVLAASVWAADSEKTSGEESILNLGEFYRCRTLLVVIGYVIDPRAYGIATHQPSIVGLQQF